MATQASKIETKVTRAQKKQINKKMMREVLTSEHQLVKKEQAAIAKQMEAKPKVAYSKKVVFLVLKHISQGMSMRKACLQPGTPNLDTFYTWMGKYEWIAEHYARATQERAEAFQEDIIDIADDSTNDYIKDDYQRGKTPGYQLNGENIQRSKLRIDTRMWIASKMKPKKYGNQLDITTDGAALPTPILINQPIEQPNRKVIEAEQG